MVWERFCKKTKVSNINLLIKNNFINKNQNVMDGCELKHMNIEH